MRELGRGCSRRGRPPRNGPPVPRNGKGGRLAVRVHGRSRTARAGRRPPPPNATPSSASTSIGVSRTRRVAARFAAMPTSTRRARASAATRAVLLTLAPGDLAVRRSRSPARGGGVGSHAARPRQRRARPCPTGAGAPGCPAADPGFGDRLPVRRDRARVAVTAIALASSLAGCDFSGIGGLGDLTSAIGPTLVSVTVTGDTVVAAGDTVRLSAVGGVGGAWASCSPAIGCSTRRGAAPTRPSRRSVCDARRPETPPRPSRRSCAAAASARRRCGPRHAASGAS